MKYKPGDKISPRTLTSVRGKLVSLPDPVARFTHVQFRRWSGCPICNVHVARFKALAEEIRQAGIQEIIFFHSRAEEIAEFQAEIPFDMVGDPTKRVYKEFGVGSSLKFALSVNALSAALKGVLAGRINLKMRNGPLGLPADFLIAPDGTVVAVNYGVHAYDQWSPEELIALARDAA